MEISIELIRRAYAEHIIQCTELAPERVEDLLSKDGEIDKARKWLAFAMAKRQRNPDNIRGLLVYLISNYSGPLERTKHKKLVERIEHQRVRLEELSYEELAGTHLRWEHVFKLVGHEFNPSRAKQRVQRMYERLMKQAQAGAKTAEHAR